jgi:hypothetical protein
VQWDKSAGAIGDLRPGEKVTVSYQDANGRSVADAVNQVRLTEEGMVQAIDPKLGTIQVNTGMKMKTLHLHADCRVVLHGGKEGALADIKTGSHVILTYEIPNRRSIVREIAQTSATFTGNLTSVDPDQKSLNAKTMFGTKRVVLGADCAIVVSGKTDGKLSDLKVGETLTVSYDDVNGINIANRIAPTEPVAAAQSSASIPPSMQQ